LIRFIEINNSKGAGLRWFNRFEKFLFNELMMHQVIPNCKNKTFNELNLRCLNYNEWVIAFSVKANRITIEAILHKSRIVD
jgi:hypothetical protein